MSGVDMVIQNLLRAAGFDPEKTKSEIQDFGRKLSEKIEQMDRNMEALKNDQESIRESIEGLRAGQVTISELLLEISRAERPKAHANGSGI